MVPSGRWKFCSRCNLAHCYPRCAMSLPCLVRHAFADIVGIRTREGGATPVRTVGRRGPKVCSRVISSAAVRELSRQRRSLFESYLVSGCSRVISSATKSVREFSRQRLFESYLVGDSEATFFLVPVVPAALAWVTAAISDRSRASLVGDGSLLEQRGGNGLYGSSRICSGIALWQRRFLRGQGSLVCEQAGDRRTSGSCANDGLCANECERMRANADTLWYHPSGFFFWSHQKGRMCQNGSGQRGDSVK